MKFFHHIKSRCVVYASLFALSLFLFSCEDVVEVDLASSDNRLVIDAEILWDDSPQELSGGETVVIPVTITAPDKIGNYLYKVTLTDEASGEEYATKTFFVKTT